MTTALSVGDNPVIILEVKVMSSVTWFCSLLTTLGTNFATMCLMPNMFWKDALHSPVWQFYTILNIMDSSSMTCKVSLMKIFDVFYCCCLWWLSIMVISLWLMFILPWTVCTRNIFSFGTCHCHQRLAAAAAEFLKLSWSFSRTLCRFFVLWSMPLQNRQTTHKSRYNGKCSLTTHLLTVTARATLMHKGCCWLLAANYKTLKDNSLVYRQIDYCKVAGWLAQQNLHPCNFSWPHYSVCVCVW